MPIYEYMCPACGHHFEKLVKLSETPVCPACQCAEPERKFSMSAGISTGRTRDRAYTKARARATETKKEQDHAHAEYLRKHHEDHH